MKHEISSSSFFLFHYCLGIAYSVNSFGLQVGLYNALWVCSLSILLSAYGLIKMKPDFVAAGMVAVGSGHILWILDTAFIVFGGMEVGPFDIADYRGIEGHPTVSEL